MKYLTVICAKNNMLTWIICVLICYPLFALAILYIRKILSNPEKVGVALIIPLGVSFLVGFVFLLIAITYIR